MRRIPSLRSLAYSPNPFDNLDDLKSRLAGESAESKHLEWKLLPPTGPEVIRRTKYRFVKAVISFANTEGGFVIVGTNNEGKHIGLDTHNQRDLDLAKLDELINGCVFPSIRNLNLVFTKLEGVKIGILHIPPSPEMPHVTTKSVTLESDQRKAVLARHVVYTRQGAKSDIARPEHHQAIIKRRTESLRRELLRAIENVQVPYTFGSSAQFGGVFQITDDPTAPRLNISHVDGSDEGGAKLVHESLHPALFDTVKNVIHANALLATKPDEFVLGERQYHRIYAARNLVPQDKQVRDLLAKTGLHMFYAPHLFWLSQSTPTSIAKLIMTTAQTIVSPQIYSLMRIVLLLGGDTAEWFREVLNRRWGGESQRPDYYWSFTEWMAERPAEDPITLAAKSLPLATFKLPGTESSVGFSELAEQRADAETLLSQYCDGVSQGIKEQRGGARVLDLAAYADSIVVRADAINRAIRRQLANP